MEKITDAIGSAQERAPVGAALAGVVDREIARLPAPRRNGARYAVNTEIVHEYAEDPSGLSLRYFDDSAEQEGGDLLLPDGYAGLLAAFHPASETCLNCVVSEITHSRAGVTVTTSRGVFTADAAIVTLPLGVLKANSVRFVPSLPPAHAQAIQRLGFGTLNKIFLTFPHVAWPKEPHLFGFVGDGWWEEWVNLFPVTGRPVLLGFNGGTIARKSEAQSDAQLAASAMGVLRRMFGKSLPNPTSVVATRWSRDPWSLGSYSCMAPGSSPEHRAALAAPVAPNLCFAGEACSPDHPSTVHGAYQSGVAAANKLLAAL